VAHFKRKKSRSQSSGYYSRNALKHRLGNSYHDRLWLGNWPRHWDKVFHTKPARAKAARLETGVLRGEDPDNIVWPDRRRPHIYYW